jgi:membrane-associated phospholipid phosphatase
MRHPLLRPVLVLALAALVTPFVPLRAQASAAVAQATDYAALIGDFPRPGSDRLKADEAILMWLQQTRSPEDVQRAASEVVPHLGLFSAVLGRDLDSGRFPLTLALGEQARHDLRAATDPLKLKFARPRPYAAMPQLTPAVKLEESFSYPSGHSAWGVLEAELLAQLQPGNRKAILARGRQVGYDRPLGGVHYPSDVEAGQALGAAFAAAWLAEPAHRALLEQARTAEW